MARLIDSLKGHEKIWQQLMNMHHRGRLPHALAFAGPPGIGKLSMAWAFAQALLCAQKNQAPCGTCPSCLRVSSKQSENILCLQPDPSMIKIEQAQDVLRFLALRRLGSTRVVVIDQAQTLNPQAANSLLKIIEEPPPETLFILIVPELSQLLQTLRSRLQVVRFQPLLQELLANLRPEASRWSLSASRGSLARLDEFSHEDQTLLRSRAIDFAQEALAGERTSLNKIQDIVKDRESVVQFLQILEQIIRDWAVYGSGQELHSDLKFSDWPAWELKSKINLWRKLIQAEADLNSHVDRTLVCENLFRDFSPALAKD